jgi:hypothetical protein
MGAATAKAIAQATWALAALMPLASRINRQTMVTAVKATAAALPIGLVLEALSLLGAPPLVIVACGALACAVYLVAVDLMRLLSARSVVNRFIPISGRT